jgi:hypothetical protein
MNFEIAEKIRQKNVQKLPNVNSATYIYTIPFES